MGFGVLLVAGVLTLDDIAKQGDTLATFLWLAVLFALSGQLNELGFMGYVGERLASRLGGLSWPALYVTLIALYVGIHYLFVSQTSQVLALLGVFLDVGIRGGVPAPLMAFGLLFASSYFSVITPQGGSQNIIFVASGYLTQRELYKLGFFTTLAFLAVFLLIGTPWVLLRHGLTPARLCAAKIRSCQSGPHSGIPAGCQFATDVSPNGMVYAMDLGKSSAAVDAKMTTFDPGAGWNEAAR